MDNYSVAALYDQFAPRLLGLCLRYTGDLQDAEDVLHDGFLKIISNIGKFSSRNPNSLEAWMKRIMVNTSLNYLRDNRKEQSFVSLEESDMKAEDGDQTDFSTMDIPKQKLMDMICQLPQGYRTVFNLYVMEDYSHKEIAGLLGCTENTSKSQLSKARKFLRKRLEEYKKHENQKQGTIISG